MKYFIKMREREREYDGESGEAINYIYELLPGRWNQMREPFCL